MAKLRARSNAIVVNSVLTMTDKTESHSPLVSVKYRDDVSTREHCQILADYLERKLVSGEHWPTVELGAVLPSARDMMVRALRELAPSLPSDSPMRDALKSQLIAKRQQLVEYRERFLDRDDGPGSFARAMAHGRIDQIDQVLSWLNVEQSNISRHEKPHYGPPLGRT